MKCALYPRKHYTVLKPRHIAYLYRLITINPVIICKTCVEHLLDSSSPALNTVKMQVHFDMNYSSRGMFIITHATLLLLFHVDEFLQEHHLVLVTRLLPIVREIADARARNRDELEGTIS